MNEGKICEVVWYDAKGERNLSKELVKNTVEGKELLAKKHTYGKILKICEDAIFILYEETEGDENYDDITIVPREWIIKPKI